MKFNLSDFLELDTTQLLVVNGGYYCNGSTPGAPTANPYYTGNSSSSSSSSCSSKSGSGGCGKNDLGKKTKSNGGAGGFIDIGSGAGTCGFASTPDSYDTASDYTDVSSWTESFSLPSYETDDSLVTVTVDGADQHVTVSVDIGSGVSVDLGVGVSGGVDSTPGSTWGIGISSGDDGSLLTGTVSVPGATASGSVESISVGATIHF